MQPQDPNPGQNPTQPANQPPQPISRPDFSYPGYGERHDIFYNPPEKYTRSQNPAYSELVAGDLISAAASGQKSGFGKKKILITGVVLLVLIGGMAVLAMSLGKKSPNQNQPASDINSSQDGKFDEILTDCYSFDLPTPNGPLSECTECAGSYLSGETRAAGVKVLASFYPYLNLDEAVADWKKIYPDRSVSSESDLELGSYSAKRLVWRSGETGDAAMMSIIAFIGSDPLGSAKYEISGSPIAAFDITGRYDQHEDSKFIFDGILSSWKWL